LGNEECCFDLLTMRVSGRVGEWESGWWSEGESGRRSERARGSFIRVIRFLPGCSVGNVLWTVMRWIEAWKVIN